MVPSYELVASHSLLHTERSRLDNVYLSPDMYLQYDPIATTRGRFGFRTSTMSPFFRSLTRSVHLGRVFSIGKYSFNHLDHTREVSSWTLRYLSRELNLLVSKLSGANSTHIYSYKKLLGVNGTSSLMFAD